MSNITNRASVVAPNIFRSVQATALGNTAVWTPATGNMFRLMKYRIQVSGNASLASAAVATISFQDGTTALPIPCDVFFPAAAGAGASLYDSGWVDLGSGGITSATANNPLNVSLGTALATGDVRVSVAGVEV
jgi:hypothetical protein